MSAEPSRYHCQDCGTVLDDRSSACPSCGRRDVFVIAPPAIAHAWAKAPSLKIESLPRKVADFAERDWRWLTVLVTFTVAACAVSAWVLSGWVSFLVDLALAVVGGFIGGRAVWRVVERERETRIVS